MERNETLALLAGLSKEELLRIVVDDAKNWLAHDGLWFLTVERHHGLDAAVRADREAWERFTVIEARRIMARLDLEPGGGIPALVRCLPHRMYARLNRQEVEILDPDRAVLRMIDCRVQETRRRKGLPDFPCKTVGEVEFAGFARTVDPRIRTRCIACPPDEGTRSFWCAWEFSLDHGGTRGGDEG